MKLHPFRLLLAAAIVLLASVSAPAHSQVLDLPPHPRLIVYGTAVNPTRLQELRSQVDETGDPQQWSERKKALVLAFRSLRAGSWVWFGRNLEAEWDERPIEQDSQYRCLATLALTDLLMKDKGSLYPEYAEERIYAQKANGFLHWWRDHGYKNWGQHPEGNSDNELAYAELLAGYALFYDWCHDYLSIQDRAYHARAIYHLMTDDEHMYYFNQGDWREGWFDNNHLGVIFGAVGLAALALDQGDPVFTQTASDSIAWYRLRAASRVREYLDAGFPIEGAGIEGLLYAMYGLNLALPYALATERLRTVTAGFDPLPASMCVEAPRNAYQVPTWLFYEQLPFNTCGGTPLNDTAIPPFDMNPGFRAWPWLMALSSEPHPNLAVPFFHTIYTPAMVAAAVAVGFDYRNPDPINDPFDIREPTAQELECLPSALNSCGILLGWPEEDPHASLDPSILQRGMYFSGRGITYFRTGVQLLNPNGTLAWKPDSCLITFECRQHPAYPPGHAEWKGHTQQDVNHFTVFFARQPLFYDSGYSGWGEYPSFFSIAHSLHNVRVGSGPWHGFVEDRTMGTAIGSVIGSGNAPSLAGGINTACWLPTEVTRSVRRIVVLPRPDTPAPYLFIHDDFELTAPGRVRANMQTGNEYASDSTHIPLIDGNIARWDKEGARAVLAFLHPEGMNLVTPHIVPNDPIHWPPHWVVRAVEPIDRTRHQIVSMIEPRYVDDTSPELAGSYVAIPTDDPEGLAYQVDSGRFTDIVAFRPYDRVGDWWIYPQGYLPIGAGENTVMVLRFDDQGRPGRAIEAGLLSGGGSLRYGDHLVAAFTGDRAASLAFSDEAVSIWSDGWEPVEYFLDPLTLTKAIINGQPVPVSVLAKDDADQRWLPSPRQGERSNTDRAHQIPSPLRAGAQIELSGGGGPITIGVYDVSGRLLRRIESGASAGNLHFRWDGRTADGGVMRTGVYMLRIRQGDTTWNRNVLILR